MSQLASLARLGAGRSINPTLGARPARRLILYEFEGCSVCRRVREAISDLDLEVEVRPCPKEGVRFRPSVQSREGASFPFLIDPNQGVELFESRDIIAHLYRHYGDGRVPTRLTSALFRPTSVVATMLRGVAGTWRRASYVPDEPLSLEGFEGDADARLVRERLSELELPYIRRNGAVVRLVDPSTSVTLEGSDAILAYLRDSWDATTPRPPALPA